MTRERNIERVLEAWLEPGPTEMPDRLFDDIVDRIERVPQRRLVWTHMRFPNMNMRTRIVAIAAIVIVALAAGFAVINRPGPLDVGSSPTPTSSATAGGTPLPAELQHLWIGETRQIPDLTPAADRSGLRLIGERLEFSAGSGSILYSRVFLDSPGHVRFESMIAGTGCKQDDAGVYAFTLSPGGGAMTLEAVADACSNRAAAISGNWVRSDCPNSQGWCLGDLEAGVHVSAVFNPYVAPANWTYSYGRFSYTVPAGWRNIEDCTGCYFLAKQGGPKDTGIFLFDDVVPHAQGAGSCTETAEPGIGRTPAAIATWLTTVPGLVTTTPAPIAIGGLSGFTLDLFVDPGWTATCPYAYSPGRSLVSTFTDSDPGSGFDWNIQGEGHTRIILLDLGDGRSLLIDVEAQSKADWDALEPGTMSVINTFEFKR